MGTIEESWKDPSYVALANKRYIETQQSTEKFLNQKISGSNIPKYNLSNSNPKSESDALSKGLVHEYLRGDDNRAKEIFTSCENFFSEANSGLPVDTLSKPGSR